MNFPEKSLKLQEKGCKVIPGLTQLLSKRPDQFAPGLWPGYFDKAKGIEVWDLDGNRYIDMSISGIGAVILGYCDPDVDYAVNQVVTKGNFSSLNCPEEIELAELLCEIHPWAEMVRYGRGGGEVMVMAVRIARTYTQREKVAFCYDEATEILTKDGFKKIRDIDEQEIVATLNPTTNQLEYKQIERKVKYRFSGKMIHFKGQRVDLMVTPEHKIYRKFRLRKGHHFKLVEARSVLRSKVMTQMTSVCKWKGEVKKEIVIPRIAGQTRPTKGICSFPAKAFVRFMGWYLSEGCCVDQKRGRYEISIAQDKENSNNNKEIFLTIKKLGFTPYRNGHHICFSSKELVQYLKQFGKCKDKYIPDWIKNLSTDYLSIFVGSMIKGDGTFEKGKMRKFYSTSKKLVDGMQELLLKMGYSTTVSERMSNGFSKHKIYHLYISKENILGSWPQEKYYDGYVYCVTVPNHIVLVRRNGKLAWSGNCGYHGWHDWYLAANLNSNKSLEGHLLPGLEPRGVPKGLVGTAFGFHYNKIAELEKIVEDTKGDLAAIIMEPIRNQQPEAGFLEAVRKIADKIGAVLIFDEVSAGFRMNSGGSHLLFGVEPDIAAFAKGMSNGYPMGAVIGKREVMNAVQDTFISSTYWTDRIGPAAAIATITKHRKHNVGAHLIEIGSLVQEGWEKCAKGAGLNIEVGGIKPMSHFSFNYPKAQAMMTLFVQEMLDKGFLASNRFYANYAHNKESVEAYLDKVKEVFSLIVDLESKGKVEEALKGDVAKGGFKRLT